MGQIPESVVFIPFRLRNQQWNTSDRVQAPRVEAAGRWRRPPGDGWRGGACLGRVLPCLSCPHLSRVALRRLPRRRASGGWTSAPRCHRPSELGWCHPGATVQASLGGARHRGSGWLHWLAQSEREAREAEAAAEVAAERCRYRVGRGTGREGTGRHRLAVHVLGGLVDILDFGGGRWEVCMETIFTIG